MLDGGGEGEESASSGSGDTEGGDASGAGATGIDDVGVGACFNDSATDSTSELQVIDCAQPHEAEVYGIVELDGNRAWPGQIGRASWRERGGDAGRGGCAEA